MVGLKQEFRQSQQLVMTQQLQQSIKLLQLSAVELQEFIEEELEKNPLLAREEMDGAHEADAPRGDDIPQSAEEDGAREETADTFTQSQSDHYQETSEHETSEWADEQGYAGDYAPGRHEGGDDGNFIEETAHQERSLREHLLEQIGVDFANPTERVLAAALVDMLDDAGYLREAPTRIAEQLGAEETMVVGVLEKLKRLDPVGIFARDLPECLRLQLVEINRLDPVMEVMLQHLDLLGKGDSAGLRKRCGVDDEDFAQMLADIRRCNPKPASAFTRDASEVVVPDVLVRRGRQGGWHIELNSDALPRVLIRKQYAAEVGGKSDKLARKYVNEQLANANWLIKALDQRANTILKVAEEIVKQQDMFLMHGIRFLKPLVLKDIATAIGMHESTISRVTNNKFMATPRGTLELKYFFTSSISGGTGDQEFSSKTVMYYIKEMIDGEDVKHVLSDDQVVQLLKRRNIDLARRTVTKYREAMHIPSSVVRRRQKSGAS
jgi:RNA polymerase sigma-54 factor